MPIDPQCRAFLDSLAAAGGPPLEQLPVHEARAGSSRMIEAGGPIEAVARVENRTVPGPAQPLPVRVYTPILDARLPGLVFFHGGGFVLGSLDTHDRLCRSLANRGRCVVVSVEYRLAPEHPFPAAPEDAYAATRYVSEHGGEFGIDPARLAVGGDSAGANLAAAVTLMARERGGPGLAFQLLVYPTVDWEDHDSESMNTYSQNHFITREVIDWFARLYLTRPGDASHVWASPTRADLRGLPPAMVLTAECDPLRDQGEAYARKLEAAGVAVQAKRYDGMIHPFLSLAGVLDGAKAAIDDAAGALRRALGELAVR